MSDIKVPKALTDSQWAFYQANGYVRLGRVLTDEGLEALRHRIDAIMLGTAPIDYSKLLMQLDSTTGRYEDAGDQSRGSKGATLDYRKIQDLEFDPLFLEFLQLPIFQDICRRTHGDIPISCFRAMFMNKPAHKGTWLPWHQDRWTDLNEDPQITLWTALDPATAANGCVQIIPGSHKLGLVNPQHGSGFLTKPQSEHYCPREKATYMEVPAGEAVLMHNWLLHASDVNKTDIARRAFSVCYMPATTHTKSGGTFTRVFGEGALTVKDLEGEKV